MKMDYKLRVARIHQVFRPAVTNRHGTRDHGLKTFGPVFAV